MITTNLNRIEIQLLGNLVEVNFQRITRLRRSMSSLRTARWFVCEHARALKLVARHLVRHGLQRAGVERAGDTVTSVGAAVEKRFEVHRRDGAIFLHARLNVHQHRMTAAMTIENFFTRQSAFDRPARDHGELADDDFVIERIALTAKAPAIWRGNHANVTGGKLKHFRQRAMHVVRSLRRTPQRQLLIGIKVGHRRMLFHRQMSVAFVEESVFANQVCFGKTFVNVTEFKRDFLVNVAAVAVFVNARFIDQQSFFYTPLFSVPP